MTLGRLVREGGRFRYTYDFGDNWRHDIHVEQVAPVEPGTQYPRCIAGRRACPPEDVGGSGGYEDFLLALADPRHDDHKNCVEWIGGPFDPAAFYLEHSNEALRALARMTVMPGK